jgi:otoferlin
MPRRLFPVQLKIILYTATELPEMMTDFLASVSKKILQSETWEPVDPYVEVSYNGMTPVWSEAIHLVGRFPPLIRTIKIAMKDHAAVQQDRVMASFLIDLFQISESNPSIGFLPTFGPTWVFLYGSPREYAISKDQDGLSQGMGEGVCYKGRLLMAVECNPVNGENTMSMKVQKESGVPFPEVVSEEKIILDRCSKRGSSRICFR